MLSLSGLIFGYPLKSNSGLEPGASANKGQPIIGCLIRPFEVIHHKTGSATCASGCAEIKIFDDVHQVSNPGTITIEVSKERMTVEVDDKCQKVAISTARLRDVRFEAQPMYTEDQKWSHSVAPIKLY